MNLLNNNVYLAILPKFTNFVFFYSKLENINFDKNNVEHVRKFQEAMLLVTSLINIINTPILDAKGNVTTDSGEIVEKYRAA